MKVLISKFVTTVLFLFICFNCASSYKVLCIFPFAAVSHQSVYQPFYKELAIRGHDVTVITTHPLELVPPLSNLNEIKINKTYESWNTIRRHFSKGGSLFLAIPHTIQYLEEIMEYFNSQEKIKTLVYEKFDAVIVEALAPPVLTFAHGFNTTVIGIASVDVSTMTHIMMGNPNHPILYPDVNFHVHTNLNFWQRLNVCFNHLIQIYFAQVYILYYENTQMRQYFNGYMPYISSQSNNMSLLMINNNILLDKVRPNVPNIISVSGIHLKKPKPLPQDLQIILNNTSKDVIYFSLGTTILTNAISIDLYNLFCAAFKELPYLVLWKYDGDEMSNIPDNVVMRKWFPQNDVLAHPKVKLFVTQCGVQSLEEAVVNKVPLIGVPFFGDQFRNSKAILNHEIGNILDVNSITKEELKDAVNEVITNEKYQRNIEKLALLMDDEPMKPLDRAVWWTEYVLRHKGAPHLRSTTVNLPWYQFLLLDVIAFVLLALSLALITLFMVIRTMYKVIKKRFLLPRRKIKTS